MRNVKVHERLAKIKYKVNEIVSDEDKAETFIEELNVVK